MSQTTLPESRVCGLGRIPPRYARIVALLSCAWILLILALGARMAYQSARDSINALVSLSTPDVAGAALANGVSDSPLLYAAAALVMYGAVVVAIVLCQVFQPRLTIALAFLVPISLFVLAVIISRTAIAALAACAMLATSWTTGDMALRLLRTPTSDVHAGAMTTVRIALGLGCMGTAVLILGSFNGISLVPIASLALLLNLMWVALSWRNLGTLKSQSSGLLEKLPRLDWFELILTALTAAFFLFAALATLTPESLLTASDSVRQHLPQAREIWQDHAVLFYPYMESFSASVLGASLNAVAYGLGGVTTVRIFQVLVSLCCLIAIAGLGATLAGRLAGIASAACFSAMPLVLWLTGHAYPDLLAVLFICASAQCALYWQRDGHRVWLIISGTLAGFSLATKQISALVVVALLIALAISARPGASISERVQAPLLLALACLVATTPWFVRSAIFTGTFPLLGTLLAQLNNASVSGIFSEGAPTDATTVGPSGAIADVMQGGVARTLPGIVRGPWDLTFHGAYSNWRIVRYGEFGLLLLMFLPLVFLHLCSRRVVLLAITASMTYVGWVFTIQVPRHLLPGLALLSVLAGIALADASKDRFRSLRLPSGRLVQMAAIAGLALTPFFFLPNTATFFPITVLTGATSPEDYLARVDPATAALKAATALLPADTPVAYIGEWQGDRTSTEAQLIFLGTYTTDTQYSLDTHVGDSPEVILANFERAGIHYFIWDRADTRPQDVDTTLLSGDFLLRYTTILGGDDGVYLFAIQPDGVADPTSQANMLQDPAFASLREPKNVWNGSKRDLADTGELQPKRQMPVSQRVEVASGQPYLLVLQGSCNAPTDQSRVALTWLDASGNELGTTTDHLALGTNSNSALMWRIAPQNAAAVDVGISTAAGTPCLVTNIGMYPYGAS